MYLQVLAANFLSVLLIEGDTGHFKMQVNTVGNGLCHCIVLSAATINSNLKSYCKVNTRLKPKLVNEVLNACEVYGLVRLVS